MESIARSVELVTTGQTGLPLTHLNRACPATATSTVARVTAPRMTPTHTWERYARVIVPLQEMSQDFFLIKYLIKIHEITTYFNSINFYSSKDIEERPRDVPILNRILN